MNEYTYSTIFTNKNHTVSSTVINTQKLNTPQCPSIVVATNHITTFRKHIRCQRDCHLVFRTYFALGCLISYGFVTFVPWLYWVTGGHLLGIPISLLILQKHIKRTKVRLWTTDRDMCQSQWTRVSMSGWYSLFTIIKFSCNIIQIIVLKNYHSVHDDLNDGHPISPVRVNNAYTILMHRENTRSHTSSYGTPDAIHSYYLFNMLCDAPLTNQTVTSGRIYLVKIYFNKTYRI